MTFHNAWQAGREDLVSTTMGPSSQLLLLSSRKTTSPSQTLTSWPAQWYASSLLKRGPGGGRENPDLYCFLTPMVYILSLRPISSCWHDISYHRCNILKSWACVCLVAQSCPTLCDPMGCSPPGSSGHGTLQARILDSLLQRIFLNHGSNLDLLHC